jgi:3-hydroxyisobutyrate dehydrogenase
MAHSETSAGRATPAGTAPTAETVAVLGAGGTMGFAMARNIARARIAVRAWNRTRGKAEPLAADGAYIARTPADAAAGAGIVLTMLADADAVVTAMEYDDGALPVMADGGGPAPIWLQMSTIGEEATEWCIGLAGRYGVGFVDAPVLGTREPAEKGQLVVLESGPGETLPRVQPVFDAVGHRTVHAGAAGAGTRLKLVTNSWVLAVVETGAETFALAEGLGVDPALFFQAIEKGPLDLPYLRLKAKAIAERDFTPSFRLRLAAKDAALVTDAAWQHGLTLPVVEAIARRMAQGAADHGDEDVSATYLTSAPEHARLEHPLHTVGMWTSSGPRSSMSTRSALVVHCTNRHGGRTRRRSPPCMRWRGPRLVPGRPGRLPGRLTPQTARRGQTSARPAGFPAPPASQSHLRMMPVSNGESILTAPAWRPQGSAGIHFRFFYRPHFIHRRWLVIRITRRLSTGLCTAYPQVPWITSEIAARGAAR